MLPEQYKRTQICKMSQYHEMKYQQKYFPFSWFQLGVGKSGGVIFFFQFQRGGEGYLKHYSIYD